MPGLQPDLCAQLRLHTWQWIDHAVDLYQIPIPRLNVRCDLRGAAAGQLRRYQNGQLVIRYNLSIAKQQPEAFIEQTVPHEVAHLVVWLRHGRKARAHGYEWQSVMHDFERPAERCHAFEVDETPVRRQRRWTYSCACRQHQLSTTRHNRVNQGHQYLCRECGEPLQPA